MSTTSRHWHKMIDLGIERPIAVLPVRHLLAAKMTTPTITLTQLEQRDHVGPVSNSPQTMTPDASCFPHSATIRTTELRRTNLT
jgi:hypothetical protein